MRHSRNVMLAVLALSLAAPSFGTATSPKKVACTIEIMPNYIWHLLAASNIWNLSHSEYASRYGTVIPDTDKAVLFAHRHLLVWGNGKISKFTPLLFFVPFSQEMTPSQYWDYLDAAARTMATNAWSTFADQYCPAEKVRISSFQFTDVDIAAFETVRAVIKKNFPAYERSVWPAQKTHLIDVKHTVDRYFAQHDIVGAWEQKLTTTYGANAFYPVLTYANGIDNLASANDLSASRNNFAARLGHTDDMIDLMIHEIGIFALQQTITELYRDPQYHTPEFQKTNAVYQAIESYIEVMKGQITGRQTKWEGKMFGGASFDFEWFFAFYKDRAATRAPADLLREAIAEFSRTRRSL